MLFCTLFSLARYYSNYLYWTDWLIPFILKEFKNEVYGCDGRVRYPGFANCATPNLLLWIRSISLSILVKFISFSSFSQASQVLKFATRVKSHNYSANSMLSLNTVEEGVYHHLLRDGRAGRHCSGGEGGMRARRERWDWCGGVGV